MNYFETLPKILINDRDLSLKLLTNLLTRSSIIDSILQNTLLFYEYILKDTDTPEIVADKYYGDSNRFWIVMFSNQLLDPQWDWPMNGVVFQKYLDEKYTPSELVAVNHYEKIVTKTDNSTQTITNEVFVIDEDTYNTLIGSTNTFTLPTGTVTVTVTKRIVDNLHYEMELNESKRTIKLLNKDYASELEFQLKKIMST